MFLRIGAVLFSILAILTGAGTARAEKVALVIGNAGYLHAPELKNPRNDAADISAALRDLGFQVIEGLDLDKAGLEASIKAFARALADADLGLLFYAGHGIQVNNQNYLVPVDAKVDNLLEINFELVRLDFIQQLMEQAVGARIILLDACRDSPFTRSLARSIGTRSIEVSKGLAVVEPSAGTLISFSTQPGAVAYDGAGRNSPYAKALLNHIKLRGEDLSSLLILVRNDVMAATKDQQVPWDHSALKAKIYFTPQIPKVRPAILFQEPTEGSLMFGERVWIDDGTCPKDKIKEVTGGDMTRHLPRTRQCVAR